MNQTLLAFHEPLCGTLVKRYKRFFADVTLDSGETVTAHCTNTGSMKGVCVPGSDVVLSRATNPDRKLKFTWEATALPELKKGQWVGINTANPNKLVGEALKRGLIKDFGPTGDTTQFIIQPEVVVAPGSRLDFCITEIKSQRKTYIEVKNVTLTDGAVHDIQALFPDSVSERATKHLRDLQRLADEGHKAVVLFALQRPDCMSVAAAAAIDPVYAQTLAEVTSKGVRALAVRFTVTATGIAFDGMVPVITGLRT